MNEILKSQFDSIHALAIEAYTPEQWTEMNNRSDLKSPNCRGGSKL